VIVQEPVVRLVVSVPEFVLALTLLAPLQSLNPLPLQTK
jgi:hypothetical protein